VTATPLALLGAPFSLPEQETNPVSLLLLLAGMSLLPFLLVMFTSFTKISVVLSLTRSALGTQQAPPTVVLTGLSAVLSLVVMSPVAEAMLARVQKARLPAAPGPELVHVLVGAAEPLRAFLVEHGSADLRAEFAALTRELRGSAEVLETDLAVVAPAFVLSELKQAFQIGFLVFLPFLVVDMVVANVLLALGMQSLSPSQVSLPFKVLLFVAVDGWSLLARSLVQGYRA
jgi:type III secretion protein R